MKKSSDSWDDSSVEKLSMDDATYENKMFSSEDGSLSNIDYKGTEACSLAETEKIATRNFRKEKSIIKESRKESPIRADRPKRKQTLQPSEVSDLDKALRALNDERPDIFSVLFQKYLRENGISTKKPTSVIRSESLVDLVNYELEDEYVSSTNINTVIVACFKLPINVTFTNPGENPHSKPWKVTTDTTTYLSTIYKFRRERIRDMIWVGFIGTVVEPKYQEELATHLYKEFNCIPIYLTEDLYQSSLFEYCNKFLHKAFFNLLDQRAIADQEDYLESYNAVNQLFADKILDTASTNSLVLIQDYHLMLVPKYISQKKPNMTLSYTFNTPFPTIDIMRIFYNKNELVESLLCCDLLCFVTDEYLKRFSSFCAQNAGMLLDQEKGGHLYLSNYGRKIYLRLKTPSVDPQDILEAKSMPTYRKIRDMTQEKYANKKFLLTFSCLTASEAIENLLIAAKKVFQTYKEQQYYLCIVHTEDTNLLLPNNDDTKSYIAKIKNQITTINNELSKDGIESAIEFIDEIITYHEKLALMKAAHLLIALSPYIENSVNILEFLLCKSEEKEQEKSSTMNGTTHNDVACTQNSRILVSDLFDGLKCLASPVRVNPLSRTRMFEGLIKALSIDKDKLCPILDRDHQIIANFTIWDRYHEILVDLRKLQSIKIKQNLIGSEDSGKFKVISANSEFSSLNVQDLVNSYKEARRKVIICSYEDTLIDENTKDIPSKKARLDIINRLCTDSSTAVYILSDKKVDILAGAFEEVNNISLLAESGFFYKMSYETNWYNMYECDWSWRSIVQRIMQTYATRAGGIYVEANESIVSWNHGSNYNEVVQMLEEEMVGHLASVLTHVLNLEIIRRSTGVEVKAAGINKVLSTLLYWMLT